MANLSFSGMSLDKIDKSIIGEDFYKDIEEKVLKKGAEVGEQALKAEIQKHNDSGLLEKSITSQIKEGYAKIEPRGKRPSKSKKKINYRDQLAYLHFGHASRKGKAGKVRWIPGVLDIGEAAERIRPQIMQALDEAINEEINKL